MTRCQSSCALHCRCITFPLSPDCTVGLRRRHGETAQSAERRARSLQEIILEFRQPVLERARRFSLMHAGVSYHVRKKPSSPTALPVCVSAGTPAKRGNMISWLFANFPAQATPGAASTSTRFPTRQPSFHRVHSIRSVPPNFTHFFLTLITLHHTFCFRCPISLSSQFQSQRTCDNTTQSGSLSLLLKDQHLLLLRQADISTQYPGMCAVAVNSPFPHMARIGSQDLSRDEESARYIAYSTSARNLSFYNVVRKRCNFFFLCFACEARLKDSVHGCSFWRIPILVQSLDTVLFLLGYWGNVPHVPGLTMLRR